MEQKETWLDRVNFEKLSLIGSGNAFLPWCIMKNAKIGTYKDQPAIYVSTYYADYNKLYEYILTEYDIFETKSVFKYGNRNDKNKYLFNDKTKKITKSYSYTLAPVKEMTRKLPDEDKRVIFWREYLRKINGFIFSLRTIDGKCYSETLNEHIYNEMEEKVDIMRREIVRLKDKEISSIKSLEKFAMLHNIKR